MVEVDDNASDLADIEYDALGRRLIYTDANDQETLYYYDGIRVILEKVKDNHTWETSKVYTLQGGSIGFIIGERVCDLEGGGGEDMDYWYHYDRFLR